MTKTKLKKFLRIFSAPKSGKTSKFPTLAVILLIFAIVWIFSELGYLAISIPWIPVVIAIIAIGMIFNRFSK